MDKKATTGMPTISPNDLPQAGDATASTDLAVSLDTASSQQHDGDMERLASLEARFDAVLPTLATKADIESLRSEIHRSSGETHKWMLGTVIGLFLGFGGLFLAMSNALKPSPASPAVVYAFLSGLLAPQISPAK